MMQHLEVTQLLDIPLFVQPTECSSPPVRTIALFSSAASPVVHAIGDAVASIRKVATQSAIRATVLGSAVVLLRFVMLHLRHLAEQAAITYLRGVDAWSLTWDCTIQLVLLEFSIL